jgi:hypothetical protein
MTSPKIPQRIPWQDSLSVPEIVPAYMNFSEVYSEEGAAEAFHARRLIAKGKGVTDPEEAAEAALELASKALWADGRPSVHAEQVYESVKRNMTDGGISGQTDLTVCVPTIVRDYKADEPTVLGKTSKNALATAYSLELAEVLTELARQRGENIRFVSDDQHRLLRADSDQRLPRREATTYERFSRQNIYNFSQFKAGDFVLLADDHVQTGASLKNQLDAAQHAGVKVVGIAAFGALSESLSLEPKADVRTVISRALWHNRRIVGSTQPLPDMMLRLNNALELSGMSYDSLTNRELITLAGLFVDRTDPKAEKFYNDLKDELGASAFMEDDGRDSLELGDRTAITVEQFYDEMRINQFTELIMISQPHAGERNANTDPSAPPVFFVSAGGAAVGKSAMVDLMERKGFFPKNTLFIGHDMIAECFTDDDRIRHFHPELLKEHVGDYHQAVNRLVHWAVENKYSVVLQDHLQDPEWIESLANETHETGYKAYATGLFLDEDTMRRHRTENNQLGALTPISVQMVKDFARNWDDLMSRGLFDHALLFHRVKPANAQEWTRYTKERLVKAAEYTLDPLGKPVMNVGAPVTLKFEQPEGGTVEREVDAYDGVFRRWQKIVVNHEAEPGSWEGIITGEEPDAGFFRGRVVRSAREGGGEAAPERGTSTFAQTWDNTL